MIPMGFSIHWCNYNVHEQKTLIKLLRKLKNGFKRRMWGQIQWQSWHRGTVTLIQLCVNMSVIFLLLTVIVVVVFIDGVQLLSYLASRFPFSFIWCFIVTSCCLHRWDSVYSYLLLIITFKDACSFAFCVSRNKTLWSENKLIWCHLFFTMKVESGGGSPVDVARSYMKDRPLWTSPGISTPLTATMKLFKEGTSYSIGHDSTSTSKVHFWFFLVIHSFMSQQRLLF